MTYVKFPSCELISAFKPKDVIYTYVMAWQESTGALRALNLTINFIHVNLSLQLEAFCRNSIQKGLAEYSVIIRWSSIRHFIDLGYAPAENYTLPNLTELYKV